jgi:MoaA/NifB/PqqE/SkfB family radical SAM enzyme
MDLSWEAFQRVAAAFDQTQHVHLQGWGEPLLHPRLLDMISVAKEAGCRAGLTTNGMRLSTEVSKGLLDLDLDLIAVSIAGATRATHEAIRAGSDLPLILENVRQLLALRGRRGVKRPKLEFSYLMTKTNLAELPAAVDLVASLGADELYAINLDYVVRPEHDALKAFGCPSRREEFGRIVEEVRERARRAGLAFRPYPLDGEEVAICEGNPTKILFISADGWVSPCTYMGLAGRTDIPRRFDGESLTVPRLRFGNVLDQDLGEIWNSPAYQAFRWQFARRRLGVAARAMGTVTGDGDGAGSKMPPAPAPCLTCYKLYGL